MRFHRFLFGSEQVPIVQPLDPAKGRVALKAGAGLGKRKLHPFRTDVEQIDFDRPPEMYPPLRKR